MFELRPWRNRHTRTFEGRVQQWVRVQVPSTALFPLVIKASQGVLYFLLPGNKIKTAAQCFHCAAAVYIPLIFQTVRWL